MTKSETEPGRAIARLTEPVDADVVVPGSKSHTNRAFVCAALASGPSELRGVLFADDTRAMMDSLSRLELDLEANEEQATVTVHGTGGVLPRRAELDVRQSGTTGRFLLPMLTLGQGEYVLDGDPQLRARPFSDLIDALHGLGASIQRTTLPLQVSGSGLGGGRVSVPGSVSSQFLSGLLLSAPLAGSPVTIDVEGDLVSVPYVELTLRTMAEFGAEVEVAMTDHGRRFVVSAAGYEPAAVELEPDASAASYFFAAAAITGGRVRVQGLGTSTIQGDIKFVDVLEQMGARVTRGRDFTEVQGPDQLQGIEVDMADISDTAQTLAAVAPFAHGPTSVRGIGFIRKKETDRIHAVVSELNRLGVAASEHPDGFDITPASPQWLAGSGPLSPVRTYDDHRMAMSFALLGLRRDGIVIENPGCVNKTFPSYFEVLGSLSRTTE